MPEEGVENYDTLKAAIEAENEEIRKKNEGLAKLKAKIGFVVMEKIPEPVPPKVVDDEGNPIE